MTKVRAWQTLLGLLVVWLLAATPAQAQSVAGSQLSGVVRDASGAAVPGAEVTVTKTDTGQARTVHERRRRLLRLPQPARRALRAQGHAHRASTPTSRAASCCR